MKLFARLTLSTLFVLILAACSGAPEEIEVTRIVTEEVTISEEVEVTRLVTEEVTVTNEVEVEVTRLVETTVEVVVEPTPEPQPEGPPPFEPPTAVWATGLANPRQLMFDPTGNLYIAEAGISGDSAVFIDEESSVSAGLSSQISMLDADGNWLPVVTALPSIGDRGSRGAQAIVVTEDSYWIGIGEAPSQLFGSTLFYSVLEVDRETLRIKTIIDTAAAATALGQPVDNAINSDPVDLALSEDGVLYIADAGCNCLWSWTASTGIQPFVLWDIDDNPVPTGVAIAPNGDIYVSFLSGFPFDVGSSRIEQYSAAGELLNSFPGLTLLTDVMVAADGTIYAVELAAGFGDAGFIPDSGRVVTVAADGTIETVLGELRNPYGIAQAPDGTIVVTVNANNPTSEGMIIEVE